MISFSWKKKEKQEGFCPAKCGGARAHTHRNPSGAVGEEHLACGRSRFSSVRYKNLKCFLLTDTANCSVESSFLTG